MGYIINNPVIGILENTKVSPHNDGVGFFQETLFTPETDGKSEVIEDVFWRVKLQPYVIESFDLKSRFKEKLPEWILVGFARLIWNNAFRDNDTFFNYAYNGPVDRNSDAGRYRQLHRVDLNFMKIDQLAI